MSFLKSLYPSQPTMLEATTVHRMGKPRLQVLPVVHEGLFMGSEQRHQTWKVQEAPRETRAEHAQCARSEGSAPCENLMSIGKMGKLREVLGGNLGWQSRVANGGLEKDRYLSVITQSVAPAHCISH